MRATGHFRPGGDPQTTEIDQRDAMDCRVKPGNDEIMRGILNSKDFWGGLSLIAIGVAAMVIGRDYPFGSALRMGPGYFPNVLGALLTLFGLYLVVQGVRASETIEGS